MHNDYCDARFRMYSLHVLQLVEPHLSWTSFQLCLIVLVPDFFDTDRDETSIHGDELIIIMRTAQIYVSLVPGHNNIICPHPSVSLLHAEKQGSECM